MDFYPDENSSEYALIGSMLRLGLRVVTAFEAGLGGRPDREHLEFALSRHLVLITADVKDFTRIHGDWMATGRHHAGIVIRRQQAPPGITARELRRLQRSGDLSDQICWLPTAWRET